MLGEIATVIGLLGCVVALATASRRSSIPYPTIMVVAGLVIGVLPKIPTIKLNPDVVFLIFLPPILYAAAWNTWWDEFRRNIRDISLLAVGLVLFTTAGVALAAKLAIPGMTWPGAFLLGAIVSPPDAAAATAICQRLGVTRKIVAVLEGESLVNDAAGLICYRVAIAAIATGAFSLGEASLDLVVKGAGGIAIGIAGGWCIAQLHQRLRDPTITTAISLLAPFISYLPAELVQVSGVLSTVAAGLFVSRRSPHILSPLARLQAVPVWDLVILIVNGLVFVLIGLQLNAVLSGAGEYTATQLLGYAAAVCAATIGTRVVWVFAMARLPTLFGASRYSQPNWPSATVVSWTGMRGVVSLAAALALPLTIESGASFPFRDLTILLTFSVIFATLVLQSLTLPPMIRFFGESVSGDVRHEELVTRLMTSNAAIMALDTVAADPTDAQRANAAHRVRNAYLNRVDLATAEISGGPELQPPSNNDAEATPLPAPHLEFHSQQGRSTPDDPVRLEAIRAERLALVDLRNRGEVSEEIFRRIERDLDLEEARLT